MEEQDKLEEFSLEDIMKEFGENEPEEKKGSEPVETAEESTGEQAPEEETAVTEEISDKTVRFDPVSEPVTEETDRVDHNPTAAGEDIKLPDVEENLTDTEKNDQAAMEGETVRFEKIGDMQGEVRNAQPIDDEEEELPFVPPQPEESTEPYSEQWEPEYEQPIGDYVPQKPIEFHPRSRLRELKKKLVEGPERLYYLMSEKGIGKRQFAVFLSVLLVLGSTVVTALYAAGKIPDHRLRLVVFTQFLSLLIAGLLGCHQMLEGVFDIFRGKYTLNTMLFFSFLLCCADGVLCLKELRVPCCAAFTVQVTMALWSSCQKYNTRLGQLDTMRKATKLDSITAVEDYYRDQKGLLRGEGQVEHFMDSLDDACGPEKVLQIYALAATGLAIVAGVAAFVLYRSISTAVQVAAVTTLTALPASMFIAISRPMAILEKRFHKLGTVLCGWRGVKGLCGKAMFPLDHNDLFPSGSVKLNGVKFFGSRQPDELVAYATAMVTMDGGALEPLFAQLLESRNGRHYTVEEFTSYNEGGIGGRINDEDVLVGSAGFLKAMGVEMPEGVRLNQVICLAVNGEMCGLFAVAYEKDRSRAAGLGTLSSYRGLNAVITTDDFTVSEGFIRSRFGLRTKRILFPDREERAQLREKTPDPEQPVLALTTRNGLAPFAYAVTGARVLRKTVVAGVVVHLIGGILGIAMMGALVWLRATHLLTPVNMFLYQLAWMLPGLLITEWTRSI